MKSVSVILGTLVGFVLVLAASALPVTWLTMLFIGNFAIATGLPVAFGFWQVFWLVLAARVAVTGASASASRN